tara:strand:- start:151 stop:411 length:261 start_codon:yes stop_codon:yes gene_type:complete
MATRKKSDSGAYMSQYDNEVETKLKGITADIIKLQAAIAELKAHTHDAPAPASTAPVPGDATSERLEKVVQQLRKQFPGSPAYKTI